MVHPHACGEYTSRYDRVPERVVHPHACGEYAVVDPRIAPAIGPSPRVWGIPPAKAGTRRSQWSIPTRVGNTDVGALTGYSKVVHPHACGEYFRNSQQDSAIRGPSPRVWGIPHSRSATKRENRSIPTRVGNTSRKSKSPERSAVHPHACGEYPLTCPLSSPKAGPSPRVWGIRHRL